jgi:hypothetical protein
VPGFFLSLSLSSSLRVAQHNTSMSFLPWKTGQSHLTLEHRLFPIVVAGLVPAIHVFLSRGAKDVDARDKRGHDAWEEAVAEPLTARGVFFRRTGAHFARKRSS